MKFQLKKLLIAKLGTSHAINSRLMYNNLKNDEYARKRTTLLGMRALRHILTFALFLTVAILAFNGMMSYFYTGQILMGIILFVLGVYTVAYGILFLPLSLNLTIKQLRLNKKAIGYIDLILLILVIILAVVLILFIKFS